ncbi:Retrovirus-related Pol polyprotein from transposon 17.6 [Gossypium australe]|uniref:Retrovirus-related Pol polyprotein from transposon 17.6 n=1 Tax=Gossypium australe TaxID=47621 RepID=A0A5B6X1A0_9ROSI|nr:Retrovirus-related Pol polyprotein from transposon 17.6 [Gossypium australe]
MLANEFACEKTFPYLIANRVYVYTNHSALKYVIKKREKISIHEVDQKGTKNQIVDHLSRHKDDKLSWYIDYFNYIAQGVFPINSSWKQKNKIIHE